jgi:hypothetical protein
VVSILRGSGLDIKRVMSSILRSDWLEFKRERARVERGVSSSLRGSGLEFKFEWAGV